MNKIVLGTAQFGQVYGVANSGRLLDQAQVHAILDRAIGSQIDFLDTAVAYGNSEQILGLIGVERFQVISKLPPIPEMGVEDVPAWVDDQVTGSLQRLGLDRLYGLLLHRPAQLLSPIGAELYRALQKQVVLGRVRDIGVSIYDPSELDVLIPRFSINIVQAPLNILDGRLNRSGWIDRLQESGIALHVRSAFLQGLLLMPADQRPQYFDRWSPLWGRWSSWLKDHELTPLQACLRYVLHAPGIERVVLGVDSEAQLSEILAVANEGPVPDGYQALQIHEPKLLNPSLWKIK